ncbi:9501_t:CDS:2 [Dentiscutata heterogama]|uniref:9501_t:CDS:1 n=1 Tax=Dentiscutata heterogama TaxID=1316150 RepID=A0ACA9NAR8_9GLOM|nr:9501_t:CDS:2 [Dentiscutata heterogama]
MDTFDLRELLRPIVQYPTPKDQNRIKVVITTNNETTKYILSDLNKSASLREVRRCLSTNGDVLMSKQDSQFCNKSKDKIQLECEDDFKLEDILIPEDDFYSVYIEKNSTKPNFIKLSRRLSLNKGRRKKSSDGSIVIASKSAFSIKNSHIMNVTVNDNLKRIHEKTNEDFNKFWERSFDHQDIVPPLKSSVNLKIYDIIYYEKGSIRLSRKDLEVTNEYVKAITDALDEGQSDANKKDALNKVGEEFGFFWAQEIKLGGKSQSARLASSTSTNKYKAVGGDITKCNDEGEWLESLSSYESWVIIGHDDKLSLYELLPEGLKSRIKNVIGMKVLHSDILNIKMPESIYPVPKPSNIITFKNHKIFVSIINNTNRKHLDNNVFAIRVDYQNPESPYLIIHHHLGMVIEDSSSINLSVPWIIIGYNDKFPTDEFSKTSCIENIKHIWTKDGTDTEIKLPKPIYKDYCWISTCVLDCEENPGYEFGMSNIVISHHFCQSDNIKVKICCNQHDLSDGPNLTPLIFKINCAIVLGTSDTNKSHPFIVSMDNHNWRESWSFTNLLRQHNNNSIFTGNSWHLPDNENYIFASPLYSSSSESLGPCCSLLLNINRKCPIVKSFNGNPKCMVSCFQYRNTKP